MHIISRYNLQKTIQQNKTFAFISTDAINKDVIVYIHGGAFMFGSGDRYSPHYLMDHDHGIVYVTFNYRLGPLGFLSTGDSIVPGNNGLKDQVAALTWIQRNIAGFGGDPNKVTIIGLSAGGASVHYMYLSSLSNSKYFHQKIYKDKL